MPIYIVKFQNVRCFAELVEADNENAARAEIVEVFRRGELEPDDSTLGYFEAEEVAP